MRADRRKMPPLPGDGRRRQFMEAVMTLYEFLMCWLILNELAVLGMIEVKS